MKLLISESEIGSFSTSNKRQRTDPTCCEIDGQRYVLNRKYLIEWGGSVPKSLTHET